MAPWGFHHIHPWGGRTRFALFLLGDAAFALMPWLVNPYSKRQLTTEVQMTNYRDSKGRRAMKNAFGNLIGRFRVLLDTMEQRPKVVRDIVLICVVLHNMLRTHQGRADRPPTPADDIVAIKINRWCMCQLTTTEIL